MPYQFDLSGSYTLTDISGVPSFAPNINAFIDEPLILGHKHDDDIDLTVDTPVVINFGGVVNAAVMMLKVAAGGPCVATITSASGTSQTVPFDSALVIISKTNPVTGLSLTRTPATLTTVRVFLGDLN